MDNRHVLLWLTVSLGSSYGTPPDGWKDGVRTSSTATVLGNNEYNAGNLQAPRSFRDTEAPSTRPFPSSHLALYEGPTKHVGLLSSKHSAYAKAFDDKGWTLQWYAHDYREPTAPGPVMDHNLVPVYYMGYNGLGITVAVVDGGIEASHRDLKPNIVEELSYDIIYNRKGTDLGSMTLSYEFINHATMVAGVIGMVANNTLCGTGVAFKASLASIRLLHSSANDRQEAQGFVKNLQKIDIYSASWGSLDNGDYMRSLPALSAYSFAKGASEGRGGKGAIYVFGGGAGKAEGDNCGADTYVNIHNTIVIGSATQNGKVTWYGESCAAIMATAYGSGYTGDESAFTTYGNNRCTDRFNGNSPSTPIASGIIALTLQANPNLTWRDVMHLIAMSSEVAPLANNRNTWSRNGAGFWASHNFGFGLLNAENMVLLAKGWKRVPQLVSCDLSFPLDPQYMLSNKVKTGTFRVNTKVCHERQNAVMHLENIQLNATVAYAYRGALTISIQSPKGTVSKMLQARPHDKSRKGLSEWTMKSTQSWGEDPSGDWTATVKIETLSEVEKGGLGRLIDYLASLFSHESIGYAQENIGYVRALNLRLYGTSETPYSDPRITLPRHYSAFRLPDEQTSEDVFLN